MRLWLALIVTPLLVLPVHAEIADPLVGWWKMVACFDGGLDGCPSTQNLYFRSDGTYRLSVETHIEEGTWTTVPCADLIHAQECASAWDSAILLGDLKPKSSDGTGALLIRMDGSSFQSIADVSVTDAPLISWSFLGPVKSDASSWSAIKARF